MPPEVATTPTPNPAYGVKGQWIFFDEERLEWSSLETIDGRTWVALDEATGP